MHAVHAQLQCVLDHELCVRARAAAAAAAVAAAPHATFAFASASVALARDAAHVRAHRGARHEHVAKQLSKYEQKLPAVARAAARGVLALRRGRGRVRAAAASQKNPAPAAPSARQGCSALQNGHAGAHSGAAGGAIAAAPGPARRELLRHLVDSGMVDCCAAC